MIIRFIIKNTKFSLAYSMLSIDVALNGSYWSIHNHSTFKHIQIDWLSFFNFSTLEDYVVKTLNTVTKNTRHDTLHDG